MSQCDQLAALLSDGEWWTTRDLLREVPCIVHSRVAELRRRGYVIDHETVGPGAAGSRYRLTQISAEPTAPEAMNAPSAHRGPVPQAQAEPASALTHIPGHGHPSPPAVAGAAQLTLDGVAA